MKYLFDTNGVIALLKGSSRLIRRLRKHVPSDFGLPAVAAFELYYGAFKSAFPDKNLARIEGLQFEIVALDREDARHAGEIRAILARNGEPIGPYDTLIAGQAIARELTLITNNTSEFSRVPGLKVEDWQ